METIIEAKIHLESVIQGLVSYETNTGLVFSFVF